MTQTTNWATNSIDAVLEKYGKSGVVAVSDFLAMLPTDATICWGEDNWVPAHVFAAEVLLDD